jgi:FkbM family methyltransferase
MSFITQMVPEKWKRSLKLRSVDITKRWMQPHLHGRSAYSQEGEDLVIARLLGLEERPRRGFYVDVGAHHPIKYSNTQYFYERGWRGINIDAMPGSMNPFKATRPEDINLELAVAEEEGELTYYEFEAPQLNGFNKELAEARGNIPGCVMTGTSIINARPLRTILSAHLPSGKEIDFLSVDVEGLDLEVLRSNDWQAYRPLLVLVEEAEAATLGDSCDTPIARFLAECEYKPLAKTGLTIVFGDAGKTTCGLFGVRVGF